MFAFDYFKELIKKGYKNDIGALELIRNLPDTVSFFDLEFLEKIIDDTLNYYESTNDTGFKIQALSSVAQIIPRLGEISFLAKLNRITDILPKTNDLTETASVLRAIRISCQNINFSEKTIAKKYSMVEEVLPFLFHPCSIIHTNTLLLLKLIFSKCTKEEITMTISPQLKNIAMNIQVQDFETLDLIRPRPLTYKQFNDLLSKGGSNLNPAELTVVQYFQTNKRNVEKQAKITLKRKTFKGPRNFASFIQEVLGAVVIYETLPFEATMRIELLKELENDVTKERFIEILSNKLKHLDGPSLSIYPRWENKPENYIKLMKFKEEFVDQVGIVRGNYRFVKQYNLAVLKLCMNYIQMFIYQTKKTFMTIKPASIRNDDNERLQRLKKWRPSGILLTSINSHEGPVKCLVPFADNIFASGSHDGHIKYHSLPALSRNFIHSSVLDIDLNSSEPEGGRIKVNQMHLLKQIGKLAVVTNTEEILILHEGQSKVQSKLNTGSRVTAATVYDQNDFRNCIACVNTNCEFILWDLRQKNPALTYSLSKIRGVPSSICNMTGESTNIISTYKGYLMTHDVRTNLIINTRKLVYEKKQTPILSANPFMKHTKFMNMNDDNHKDLITLTYPSKSNQFSIFPIHFNTKLVNPLIHFEQKNETKNSKPIEFPTLEDVTQTEASLDYESANDGRYEYLKQLTLNKDGIFKLGKAFYIRRAKDVLGLYTDPIHGAKLDHKKECLKNFSDVMQTLGSMGECNRTHNKILTLPTVKRSSDIKVDMENVILTAGTDRNIRFMTMGNEFDKVSVNEEYDWFNSYHLSNIDDQPRSFRYIYSQGTCILKESDLDSKLLSFNLNEAYGESQQSFKNPKNGLSYYHNSFLSQRKTSDTLPGHSSGINDILIMEYKIDQNGSSNIVVSCSDDSTVKIWI